MTQTIEPWILRDVSSVNLGTEILGRPSRLPVGIAPTGFTRMMQSEGEYAGSPAAAAAGIPYTLSTMGAASIEDVAAAAPDGRNWFQLYLWTDRDRSLELIGRATQAGTDRPAWWFNSLTHEPLAFTSLSRYTGTVADLINSMFNPP